MKEYVFLNKEKNNKYYTINQPDSSLWNLNYFFENDYRSYDKDIFIEEQIFYNVMYIYNDFKQKIMYIGFAEWSINEDIKGPSYEDFPYYVNEINSCKISHDNFIEFTQKWLEIKRTLPPFAIIYRDENEWIHCKGFDSKEDMESFVQNYQPAEIH